MPHAKQISRRPRLSCARITERAIRIIDRSGVEALSMRSLSSSLGVEAMSLYAHFSSKDELLGAVAAALLDEVELSARNRPPRARLESLARSMRRLGHAHPNAFALVILNPQRLASALRLTEHALHAYTDAGLGGRAAVQAQRVLLGFVRGYTLWEIGGFAIGCRPGPGRPVRARVARDLRALDQATFPFIHRFADELTHFSPDDEFQTGVRLILDATMPRQSRAPATRRKRERRARIRKDPTRPAVTTPL